MLRKAETSDYGVEYLKPGQELPDALRMLPMESAEKIAGRGGIKPFMPTDDYQFFEEQQELADKRLSFDLLKVNYDSLKTIHEETLALKNEQINDLNLLLKEEMSNNNSNWRVIGGMTAGIILSVAVFYASVEIVK